MKEKYKAQMQLLLYTWWGKKKHLKAFNSNNMDEMENIRVGKSLVMVVVIESTMRM